MAGLLDSFREKVSTALTPITEGMRTTFAPPTAPTVKKPPVQAPKPAAPTTYPYLDSFKREAEARRIALTTKSPFVQNVLKAAEDTIAGVGAVAKEKAVQQARNVADFGKGKLSVAPGDVLEGMKKIATGAGKGLVWLAQGFNEGILRLGTSIGDTVLPGYEKARKENRTSAADSLVTSIAGKPEISTYQDIFRSANQWAREKEATPDGASTFAGFAVLGSLFLDQPGIGSGPKVAIKIAEESLEKLAKETSEEAIKAVIKAENPSIPQEALDFIAPIYKRAATVEEVKMATKMVNNAAEAATKKAQKTAVVENFKEKVANAPGPAKVVSEARKYATLDEFIESQKPVYRGVSEGETSFKPSKRGAFSSEGLGFSVAPDKKVAAKYGDSVIEGFIAPDAKIKIQPSQTGDEVGYALNQSDFESAKAEGYDGIQFRNKDDELETLVFNPEIVKTREELASIYEQAKGNQVEEIVSPNKGVDTPSFARTPKNAPADPNLVKSLGSSKDPYEVLNIVKNAFPHLPDRVADRFVEKFARLKRVADIENMIKAARNLDEVMRAGDVKIAGKKITGTEGLPPSSAKILEKTTSPSIRKAMTLEQKNSMIRTLQNKFEDPKAAVAAEHEYNRIWDDLNQGVIDEYETLKLNKQLLEEALSYEDDGISSVYKKLFTGRNKGHSADDTIMELQEIHNRASRHKKAIENYRKYGSSGDKLYPGKPKPLTKTEEYAVKLDEYLVGDVGLQDVRAGGQVELGAFDSAQERLDSYVQKLTEIREMGDRLKELKPRVQEARILQEGLQDIAVIPRADVEAIDRLITKANVRDYATDISGLSGGWRDVYRNFEKFFGKLYPQVKKAILDPFDDAKVARVKEAEALADDLDKSVVKKFGFAKGSKESAAIQRYGDTDLPEGERLTREMLEKEFGKEKAEQIVAADAWFRETYDRLIDELNEVRTKIYPRNPDKLIAKRKNYYRHFQEMTESWGDALKEFFDTPAGINPSLIGTSEFTKPRSRFLPFAQTRLGQKTTLDAVGGFLNYAELFSYAKHIDPQVTKFRYLERKLKEAEPPRAGQEMKVDGKTIKAQGVENFLGFLDDFARDLTGNTNPLDRWTQKRIPGGRKTIRAMRWINNRMKGNTILGNLGSALAQIANLPAGIADTRAYFPKGVQRTLASIFMDNKPMAQSRFLNERYHNFVNERFPFKFTDRPFRATGEQMRKKTAWILQKMDEMGTRTIWNAEYEKALALQKKGSNIDPIRYADDRTRKMVAGRGVGEVPLDQKSLYTQFLAPFSLEVGNAWWVMKDWMTEKQFQALVTFFIANYALNEAAENVRGSRITIDPINALVEGTTSLAEEFEEENYGRGLVKFFGRQAGEVLANIPYGQTVAAIAQSSPAQKMLDATGVPIKTDEIFGDSTAGRFGTPLLLNLLDPKDAFFRFLPPAGGLQIKKTYEAVEALVRGYAEDTKGRPTFEVPVTMRNVAQALAFGAGATPEARRYYEQREDLFNALDRSDADRMVRSGEAADDWAKITKLRDEGKGGEAARYLAEVAKEDPLRGEAILTYAKAEARGLNGNETVIEMLPVKTGARAKYIADQMRKLPAKERAGYLADLAKKKLVSDLVAQQLALLLKTKPLR